MGAKAHYLTDVIITVFSCATAAILARRYASLLPGRPESVKAILFGLAVLVITGDLLGIPVVSRQLNNVLVAWLRSGGLFAAVGLVYAGMILAVLRPAGLFQPARRQALRVAATAAIAAPVAVAGFAIIRREDLTFREVSIPVPGLPHDLHGLKIAQLTDIHLSPFVDEATLNRAVGMANETRPQIMLVTGDLISTKGDPLDLCLRRLADLRGDAGVFGCLGNHERYALAEDYTERQGARSGLRFLRRESSPLRFGSATLNLTGVDYQAKGTRYLRGMETLVMPGAFNVLLSHNPDVFPVAAEQGYDLTIAGHTHGGQVTLEMIHPSLNLVRFFTPYVYGSYQKSGRQMYVSRGIGTIGVPARLGAPPEVVLLRLERAGALTG